MTSVTIQFSSTDKAIWRLEKQIKRNEKVLNKCETILNKIKKNKKL